jgi:oxaloacetate decarboxylase alpha subunit
MRHQLKIVGMEDKMDAALGRQPRPGDFGYPSWSLRSPNTRALGRINVLARRIKSSGSGDQYALGIWGKERAELMDPQVKDKILGRPRAKEWTNWSQPDPSLHEVRQKFGATVSDEELILRFFAGDDAVNALPNDGRPREYLDGTQSLVKLIEQLSKRKDSNQIYIKRPGFSVRMERRATGTADV